MAALSEVKMTHMSTSLVQLPRKRSVTVCAPAFRNQIYGNSAQITVLFLGCGHTQF